VPTAAQHIEKAKRNEAAALLIQATYPEWAVTALFYAAMHYVEAFFFIQETKRPFPSHYKDHADRRKGIALRAARISVHYETLFGDSFAARYTHENFSSAYVDRLREREFEAVKSYIIGKLPLDLRATI
jgi:hypothetical protein